MSRVFKDKTNQVTQKYKKGVHDGIDLVGYKNALAYILAHSDGEVVDVRKDYNKTDKSGSSYGNYVKIKHDNGYYTLYAHMKYNSVTVSKGDRVSKGQIIGYMGNTGHSCGAHLHFEVRSDSSTRIDPTPYIDADLPKPITPSISLTRYQVYDNVKRCWLPNVKVGEGSGISAYAGNLGNAISGVYIDDVTYRVYDNKKKQWLPWVVGRKDYAGNLGNSIGGIQIKNATYRAHIKGGSWLSWVSKVDNTSDGYAGIKGKDIDAIEIKAIN